MDVWWAETHSSDPEPSIPADVSPLTLISSLVRDVELAPLTPLSSPVKAVIQYDQDPYQLCDPKQTLSSSSSDPKPFRPGDLQSFLDSKSPLQPCGENPNDNETSG